MYIEIIKISLIAFMFLKMGEPGMVFSWYQKLIDPLPEYLWKPLGGCLHCFTGQVCFWFYFIKYFNNYSVVDHLFFASLGIFLSSLYDKIWDYGLKNS